MVADCALPSSRANSIVSARDGRRFLSRMKTLQAHIVAAIQNALGCRGFQRAAAAPEQCAAHAAGGEHRLHMRIAQPAARAEFVGGAHASENPSAAAMRARAASAVWRRPSSCSATGSRKYTVASSDGPPSRRTKLLKKFSARPKWHAQPYGRCRRSTAPFASHRPYRQLFRKKQLQNEAALRSTGFVPRLESADSHISQVPRHCVQSPQPGDSGCCAADRSARHAVRLAAARDSALADVRVPARALQIDQYPAMTHDWRRTAPRPARARRHVRCEIRRSAPGAATTSGSSSDLAVHR